MILCVKSFTCCCLLLEHVCHVICIKTVNWLLSIHYLHSVIFRKGAAKWARSNIHIRPINRYCYLFITRHLYLHLNNWFMFCMCQDITSRVHNIYSQLSKTVVNIDTTRGYSSFVFGNIPSITIQDDNTALSQGQLSL